MNKKVIIIGASGHGKVIADIVLKNHDLLVGFLDDGLTKGNKVLGFDILGNTAQSVHYPDCEFVIGIGSNDIRQKIADRYSLKWYTAIHPSAHIALDVSIGEGTVVMANAVINTAATIGRHCIINTSTVVEHDNMIEDFVHLSPNVTLCGTVHIGRLSHIGAAAAVINNIEIASECRIGAGCVVVENITEAGTYVGVPARRIK